MVYRIWCVLPRHESEDKTALADMLSALGQDWDHMLVDWWSHLTVDLRQRKVVESYLAGDIPMLQEPTAGG